MIVSDILRAAVVLLIPIAAVVNVLLVYPLIFLVTSISIFFRPARVAILPQIVGEDELVTANSAMWVGETIADVIGYPLAGLFVAALVNALPLAFWLDAATYLASAVLLVDHGASAPAAPTRTRRRPRRRPASSPSCGRAGGSCATRPSLLANTIQAAVAQFTIGVLHGPDRDLLPRGRSSTSRSATRRVWGFLESGDRRGQPRRRLRHRR